MTRLSCIRGACLVISTAIVLLLGCGDSTDSGKSSNETTNNKKELTTEIDGKWKCISAETGGGVPFKEHIGREYKYDKGKVTIWSNKGDEEGFMFYALDNTQKPKHINSWFEKRENRPTPGIYKLENDTLTICELILDKNPRPAEFSTAKGDNRLLRVLQRIE